MIDTIFNEKLVQLQIKIALCVAQSNFDQKDTCSLMELSISFFTIKFHTITFNSVIISNEQNYFQCDNFMTKVKNLQKHFVCFNLNKYFQIIDNIVSYLHKILWVIKFSSNHKPTF